MTRLEFELLGKSYARGYGAALAGFHGRRVETVVRLHRGHLYTSIREGNGLAGATATPLEPSLRQWMDVVRPIVKAQLGRLRDLVDQSPGRALRQAAELFEECVSLHHRLVLPARQVVEDFVSAYGASAPRRFPFSLWALLGVDLPAMRGIDLLLGSGEVETTVPDDLVRLLADVAPDGDGYGLAIGGWLDTPSYAAACQRFLRRTDVTTAAVARRQRLARRRRQLVVSLLRAAVVEADQNKFDDQLQQAHEALAWIRGQVADRSVR